MSIDGSREAWEISPDDVASDSSGDCVAVTIIIPMCGRYTLRVSPAELAEIFGVLETIEWSPRYNIAPTQTVAAVRPKDQGDGRELALLKWGLIPFWAKDVKIASSLINARAETVATKPAFRAALKKKRCLIPAA